MSNYGITVKKCWHGDLNKTIHHLNGYTAFNDLIFFEGSPYGFSREDLLKASGEELGQGKYGTTYKVEMENTTVVVKWLRGLDVTRFKVEILGRIGRHPNVMPLRAYYYSKDEILLVYDYMPKGSLYHWLHGMF